MKRLFRVEYRILSALKYNGYSIAGWRVRNMDRGWRSFVSIELVCNNIEGHFRFQREDELYQDILRHVSESGKPYIIQRGW